MIKVYYAIYNPKLNNYYNPSSKVFEKYNTECIYDLDTVKDTIKELNLKDCEPRMISKYFCS